MAISIKSINKEIAKLLGAGIELVKGAGYFYFIGANADTGAGGVYVYKVSELSMAEWLEEAKERVLR